MSNEAAERLREVLRSYGHLPADNLLDEALRTERRMVVEQIRERIDAIEHPCHEVCIEPLHADCQCAAWMRQEARSILEDEIGGAR